MWSWKSGLIINAEVTGNQRFVTFRLQCSNWSDLEMMWYPYRETYHGVLTWKPDGVQMQTMWYTRSIPCNVKMVIYDVLPWRLDMVSTWYMDISCGFNTHVDIVCITTLTPRGFSVDTILVSMWKQFCLFNNAIHYVLSRWTPYMDLNVDNSWFLCEYGTLFPCRSHTHGKAHGHHVVLYEQYMPWSHGHNMVAMSDTMQVFHLHTSVGFHQWTTRLWYAKWTKCV